MITRPLLGAVAAGDLRSLEPLYRALRVAVFTLSLSVVRDRSLAEDVLHETFVRVSEKAHTYRAGTRPRAWVLAIARNHALDTVRRRAREHTLDGGPPAEDDSLGALVVTSALMTLEPLEREIDGDVESEAYGVGGAMLMPYGQLFPLCRRAVPVARIAARFELSVAFTNYRINRAGLRKMYEKRMRA
jgi:hypothetical protein